MAFFFLLLTNRVDAPGSEARRGSAPPVPASGAPSTPDVSRESTLRSIDRQIEAKCLDHDGNPIPEKELLRKALLRKKLRLLQHGRRTGPGATPGGGIASSSGGGGGSSRSLHVNQTLFANDSVSGDIEAAPVQAPRKEPRTQGSKRSG